ncbi:hypothetical protein ScalyP_jg11896 [Parmales sp. scaly parma]|nr:hypothetical protein ScalyP_jg11896 [Parmales sp. scaly parma]
MLRSVPRTVALLPRSFSTVSVTPSTSSSLTPDQPFSPGYTPLGPKTSTGLVGLLVDPTPIPSLIKANQNLSRHLEALPACAYKSNVSQVVKYRLGVCADALDHHENKGKSMDECIAFVENTIGGTRRHLQVEEMIVEANDEVEVAEMYLREKMWIAQPDEIRYRSATSTSTSSNNKD